MQRHLWNVVCGFGTYLLLGLAGVGYAEPVAVHTYVFDGPVADAVVSYSGRLIAAVGGRRLVVWNRFSGEEMLRLEVPEGELLSLTMDETESFVFVGDSAGVLTVWDMKGEEVSRWPAAQGSVLVCRLSPDGTLLATGGSDGAVRLWDAASGRLREEFLGHRRAVVALAFQPLGEFLVSGGADGTVRVWHLLEHRLWKELPLYADGVREIGFVPTGGQFFSVGWDGVAYWVPLHQGEPRPLELDSPARSVLVAQRMNHVLFGVAEPEGAALVFYHYPSGRIAARWRGPQADRILIAPPGDSLLTVERIGRLTLWQVRPEAPTPQPSSRTLFQPAWDPSEGLYYEVQVSPNWIFIPEPIPFPTAEPELPSTEELLDGRESAAWWRVRAVGFDTASPWSRPQRLGLPEDLNLDGRVDVRDLVLMAQQIGRGADESELFRRADLSGDGRVDVTDLVLLVRSWGGPVAATPAEVQRLLSAVTESERSSLRVGAPFPNPANPEVWVPLWGQGSASVRVEVYDALGRRVRVMDWAALPLPNRLHWDGRNQLHERAAGGLYFLRVGARTPHASVQAVRRVLLLP
ncbi:MAG: hypothetical protein KatS3mg115_0025 [Candidatus Poribacteria bacterium]|nr:MAG: hypothetical protein KatS3mg115_0025 [Candidatus Poribacteria bacterium]